MAAPTSLDSLPDDVVLVILKLISYDDKRSSSISCKRFKKLVNDNSLKKLQSIHPIYDYLTTLSAQALIDSLEKFDDVKLANIDWSELRAYYKKNPARSPGKQARDCDRYNKDEEKQIKYAFIFCRLSEINDCTIAKDYSVAKQVLSKAKAPCTQAIPGSSGLGFGLVGALFIGNTVYYHCGGGWFGLAAAAACGVVGFPSIAIPLCMMEYYTGNYRANFNVEDVKSLLSALESADSSESEDEDQ